MTAFAFILGVLPLVLASGAGAHGRVLLGLAVFGGMLAASLIAIFLFRSPSTSSRISCIGEGNIPLRLQRLPQDRLRIQRMENCPEKCRGRR